jgi:hypothetical protein
LVSADVKKFDERSSIPFRLFNITRGATARKLIALRDGKFALRLEDIKLGFVSHIIIYDGYGVYFGRDATNEQLQIVATLFDDKAN